MNFAAFCKHYKERWSSGAGKGVGVWIACFELGCFVRFASGFLGGLHGNELDFEMI
jgi:hypothetical protein